MVRRGNRRCCSITILPEARRPHRNKKVPLRLFEGFSGYLQSAGYAMNQWPKLVVYCEDGHLNINNAAAENAIRPITIVGRKNWLFADTPNGAKASAIYYSLVEGAKANGLEPFEYLNHILK